MSQQHNADEADTTISETVSEKRRGRPRKHIALYSILEAHGGEAQAVALADSSGKPGGGYKASRNQPENDDEAILDLRLRSPVGIIAK